PGRPGRDYASPKSSNSWNSDWSIPRSRSKSSAAGSCARSGTEGVSSAIDGQTVTPGSSADSADGAAPGSATVPAANIAAGPDSIVGSGSITGAGSIAGDGSGSVTGAEEFSEAPLGAASSVQISPACPGAGA